MFCSKRQRREPNRNMLRHMSMKQWALVGVLAVAACGGGDELRPAADEARADNVPEEFRAACGKPGSTVAIAMTSGTVRRSDCDLRGVNLTVDRLGGVGGAVVPADGEGVGNSGGLVISTAPNGDVTYRFEATPK
jgi:hypothetical protein